MLLDPTGAGGFGPLDGGGGGTFGFEARAGLGQHGALQADAAHLQPLPGHEAFIRQSGLLTERRHRLVGPGIIAPPIQPAAVETDGSGIQHRLTPGQSGMAGPGRKQGVFVAGPGADRSYKVVKTVGLDMQPPGGGLQHEGLALDMHQLVAGRSPVQGPGPQRGKGGKALNRARLGRATGPAGRRWGRRAGRHRALLNPWFGTGREPGY